MQTPTTITDCESVLAALHHPDLVPALPPASIGVGPTAGLRAAMARFSSGELHAHRRKEVDELIRALDANVVRSDATRVAQRVLEGRETVDAVSELAYVIPVQTMLLALGVPGDPAMLLDSTRAIVEVIGRGAPASDRSEAATARLLNARSSRPFSEVAVASVLYQTFDATGALFIESLLARHSGTTRKPAVARTLRFATTSVTMGDVNVPEGETVVLDLGTTGLEFGAGPHECPGRAVAEAIVDGMLVALDAAGLQVIDVSSTVDPNGRPTSVTLTIPR